MNSITYLVFFFPFLYFLFQAGYDSASASWATQEVTLTARLPIVMPAMKTITPVTALLILLQGLSTFIRSLFFVATGKEL